jgi:crotonobetainyl-CoA:carnitine CoA-transferase CaiB-like acyl-CoA transferase
VIGRADLVGRRAERDLVDAAIAEWTRARTRADAEAALQDRGVPAHAVLDMPGLFACPQLQHRGHFVEIAHEIFGTTTIESSRLRFSRSRELVPECAIGFGRDNRRVLESILGYSPERVEELVAKGVLR